MPKVSTRLPGAFSKNVLLTFTGFHDPYYKGLIGDEEQPGPILSLLSTRAFDEIYLFDTPATQEITKSTSKEILLQHPKTRITVLEVPLDDPTDYESIIGGLRRHIPRITENRQSARFYISVASGTPQMHACWLLLLARQQIEATILHVRPPRFVTAAQPLVTEIRVAPEALRNVYFKKQLSAGMEPPEQRDLLATVQTIGIIGDHPSLRSAFETCAALASSAAPILLLGETGTGKELFARLVHRLSGRPAAKLVAVNCAAIPENLVESLLFGHKKGVFTGATTDQTGKFDAADGGTLFLDELGELPLATQAKLLRVLQDGIVEPIGATKSHKVDVRLIAATNRDLRALVREKKFREDLYYRLNVGEVRIPPLRDRRGDITKIALHVLDRINTSLKKPKRLSRGALTRIESHNWPGNVRDLENVLERSARLCKQEVIEADDLLISEPIGYADPLDSLPDPHEGFSLDHFLSSVRKQLILRALEVSRGNQSKAAKLLGVTPQAVHKFLQTSGDGEIETGV